MLRGNITSPGSLLLFIGPLSILELIVRFYWSLLKHARVWPQATSQKTDPLDPQVEPCLLFQSRGWKQKSWPCFCHQGPSAWERTTWGDKARSSQHLLNRFLKPTFTALLLCDTVILSFSFHLLFHLFTYFLLSFYCFYVFKFEFTFLALLSKHFVNSVFKNCYTNNVYYLLYYLLALKDTQSV